MSSFIYWFIYLSPFIFAVNLFQSYLRWRSLTEIFRGRAHQPTGEIPWKDLKRVDRFQLVGYSSAKSASKGISFWCFWLWQLCLPTQLSKHLLQHKLWALPKADVDAIPSRASFNFKGTNSGTANMVVWPGPQRYRQGAKTMLQLEKVPHLRWFEAQLSETVAGWKLAGFSFWFLSLRQWLEPKTPPLHAEPWASQDPSVVLTNAPTFLDGRHAATCWGQAAAEIAHTQVLKGESTEILMEMTFGDSAEMQCPVDSCYIHGDFF